MPKKKQKRTEVVDPERKRLEIARDSSTCPVFLPEHESIGVGKFTPSHVGALKALFYMVVSKTRGVTWGEGQEDLDPRRRMYGFLPNKRDALIESGIRIKKKEQKATRSTWKLCNLPR